MSIKDLLTASRSYRRFHQDEALHEQTLTDLVGLTCLCPSASNRQPLKYVISWEPKRNARIYQQLGWAGALADWPGPSEGERPSGYVIILGDTRIAENFFCDHGIAAQSILLAATEQGLGGCMIASFDRAGLRETLGIAEHFQILLVLALGRPKETVVLEHGTSPDAIPYWRDENGVHHVPKRSLDEVLLKDG